MRIIFLLNSDFGIGNTIGIRALPIAKEVVKDNKLTILCRGYNKNLKRNLTLFRFSLTQILL